MRSASYGTSHDIEKVNQKKDTRGELANEATTTAMRWYRKWPTDGARQNVRYYDTATGWNNRHITSAPSGTGSIKSPVVGNIPNVPACARPGTEILVSDVMNSGFAYPLRYLMLLYGEILVKLCFDS